MHAASVRSSSNVKMINRYSVRHHSLPRLRPRDGKVNGVRATDAGKRRLLERCATVAMLK